MFDTFIRLFTAPKEVTLIVFEDDDEWCIEDEENPGVSLCGGQLGEDAVPDCEVPDEMTCPECLAVESYIKRKNS